MKINSTADLGKVIRSKRKNWVIHRHSYLSIRGLVPVLYQILNETAVQLSEEGYVKAKDIREQIVTYSLHLANA